MWRPRYDWHSPNRLLYRPSIQYDFPGDRFIPNRSLMDLDQARGLLTGKTKETPQESKISEYRRKIEELMTLDSEGRPFRMLVFRGSPKSSRKSIKMIDEMRRDDSLDFHVCTKKPRRFPKTEAWILDAPRLKDDFYTNILDWGKNNVLAIALGSDLYLWNAETRMRARNSLTSRVRGHTQEICGLKWSNTGNVLASGGNDNLICIWDALKMSSSHLLHRFNEHRAAVKALAWCPYQFEVLASGGGTSDGCIKIWNIQRGICINSINTKAQASFYVQVCGLEWNKHHKEILSGHGFSTAVHQNGLCLWRYPSMSIVGEFMRHSSRVLHLSQSPDGLTAVSAGADETLRFWQLFGPPALDGSRISDLDNLLSLKVSPLR
ncbi:WD40 repeat [Dillenia turbinata]|uniref:WD40 repeat n=1 Tax=Dillenia turbinata TaxID=194707 RepID=A0AAN8VEW8_9MAGN